MLGTKVQIFGTFLQLLNV